jgi:hypothetical protein
MRALTTAAGLTTPTTTARMAPTMSTSAPMCSSVLKGKGTYRSWPEPPEEQGLYHSLPGALALRYWVIGER